MAPTAMASIGPYTTAAKSMGRTATVISVFRAMRTGWRSASTATPARRPSAQRGALRPTLQRPASSSEKNACKSQRYRVRSKREVRPSFFEKSIQNCLLVPPKG